MATEVDSEREQLFELRVIVTRDGREYVATPVSVAGVRLHDLRHRAVNRYNAVIGAVRNATR